MDKLKEFFKELEEEQDREFLCAEQIDFLIILNTIKKEV